MFPTPAAPPDLLVAVPTYDYRALIPSVLELELTAGALGRSIQFVVGDGSNRPRARNVILYTLGQAFPDQDARWVLWWDSDILLSPGTAPVLAAAIDWAEAHHVAVAADYRSELGPTTLGPSGPAARGYSEAERGQLPTPYPRVGQAGLGLAYVPQPLGYRFHADRVSEDIHLWWDHPELPIHWMEAVRVVARGAVLLT
jgi:hypothetical protein